MSHTDAAIRGKSPWTQECYRGRLFHAGTGMALTWSHKQSMRVEEVPLTGGTVDEKFKLASRKKSKK